MVKFNFAVLVLAVVMTGTYSRPSELFGSGVSQTGSKWPPYPWAGLDYWSLQAGFYGPGASTVNEGVDKAVESTPVKRVDKVPVKSVARVPEKVVAKVPVKTVTVPKDRPRFYMVPHFVVHHR